MKATIKVNPSVLKTINNFADGIAFRQVCDEIRSLAEKAHIFLVKKSPEDEGIFRTNWSTPKETLSENRIDISINNDTPYGVAIDEGSKLGHRPWPNVGPYYPKLGKYKTMLNKGRIFSTMAPEGVIEPVVDDLNLEDELYKRVYKVILKASS